MNRLSDLLDKKRKAKREAEVLDSQKSVKQARSEAKEIEAETSQVNCHRNLPGRNALMKYPVETSLVVLLFGKTLYLVQVESSTSVAPFSEKVGSPRVPLLTACEDSHNIRPLWASGTRCNEKLLTTLLSSPHCTANRRRKIPLTYQQQRSRGNCAFSDNLSPSLPR